MNNTVKVNAFTNGVICCQQFRVLREANLRYANLQYADLQHADLQHADLRKADLRYTDLRNSDLRNADLRGADLRRANLKCANLKGADLRGASLDFSSGIPLWCGGQDIKFDTEQLMQILAHAFSMQSDDSEYLRLREEARKFCSESRIAQHIDWLKKR